MDNKMNNMKQAMYEMCGVGRAPAEEQTGSAPQSEPAPAPEKPAAQPKPAKPMSAFRAPEPKLTSSYLAPGTVLCGTLHSVGDVEIAGDFQGDITTEGTVILHANIQGNLTVSCLNLSGCSLTGDVTATGMVSVSDDSEIRGNVTAGDLYCSGSITGDLAVTGSVSLSAGAHVQGDITAGSMSMERGAVVNGTIRIRNAQ